MAFLVLTFCCVLLGNFTSGLPTSTPSCPESQAWDSHLKACVSCALCEDYPETPVCTSCKSSSSDLQKVSVLSTTKPTVCESGYAWDVVQNKCVWCGVCATHPDTPICGQCTGGTSSDTQPPSCPPGTVWDGFLRRCVDCAVCETHPDTPVCRLHVCPTVSPRTEAPKGLKLDDNTVLVAVLTTVAILLTTGLGVAVWISCGPGWCRRCACGHGQQRRQFPEVGPGKTVNGYKVTQVEDDSGCSSMGSSNTSITLLTTDKVTVL